MAFSKQATASRRGGVERFDLLDVLHHETDIVETFEQTLLVIRVDVEMAGHTIRSGQKPIGGPGNDVNREPELIICVM